MQRGVIRFSKEEEREEKKVLGPYLGKERRSREYTVKKKGPDLERKKEKEILLSRERKVRNN